MTPDGSATVAGVWEVSCCRSTYRQHRITDWTSPSNFDSVLMLKLSSECTARSSHMASRRPASTADHCRWQWSDGPCVRGGYGSSDCSHVYCHVDTSRCDDWICASSGRRYANDAAATTWTGILARSRRGFGVHWHCTRVYSLVRVTVFCHKFSRARNVLIYVNHGVCSLVTRVIYIFL